MKNQTEIINALRTLGVTTETLFTRIHSAIDRGLFDEALAQLRFVDELVATGEASERELDAEKQAHEFTMTAYSIMSDERDALEAKIAELEAEKATNPNWVTSAEMQKRAVYAESKLAAARAELSAVRTLTDVLASAICGEYPMVDALKRYLDGLHPDYAPNAQARCQQAIAALEASR